MILLKTHPWRQRIKTGTYEKLNEALLTWFKSMRGNNIPINGPILLEKAHEFAKALHEFYSIKRVAERLEGEVNDSFFDLILQLKHKNVGISIPEVFAVLF